MKTKKRLSQKQMQFFDAFGYLYFPNLLDDKIDTIIEEFEVIWKNSNQNHDGTQRSVILPFADQSAYLSSLLDDPRIHDIASSICGEEFNYTSGDGNYYVGDTRWHSDGYGARPVLTIKIAFYLDKVTASSGALRVIPGSHKKGSYFADSLQNHLVGSKDNPGDLFGLNGNEIPAIPLETNPGDVAVFNHNIKHSSWGGSNSRRMFTINFTEKFRDDQLDQLKNILGKEARFWIDRIHGEPMVNTASKERMVHLKQVMENDTHLAAITKQLKKTMSEPARG